MSWSMFVIGKPATVAEKIKHDLAKNRCVEPEEAFRQDLGALIHKMVLDHAYPVKTHKR